MSVLKQNSKSHLLKNIFLDEPVDIQRYDELKYPQLEKITEKQLGFFWRPEEVDVSKDKKDFDSLTEHEKHIFTSNLKRQIVLDSVQGRAPNLAFLPIVSLPEAEYWVEVWSLFETIHSKSYTHIIRNIYPRPGEVFDEILNIPEIAECGTDIAKYYDDLIHCNNRGSTSPLEHKKAIWMAIQSANALEGIRFYISFACSWAFAELKKMEGNAKIIKFIARDENVHLASTTIMLKLLENEDKDFARISKETKDESTKLYVDVIEQEKAWAEYLFKDGSMIGVNAKLLCDYIEWIGCKRMRAIGLPCTYTVPQLNPLPWTEKWISGGNVQVAPQETEISSYITGGVKQDVDSETLSGLSL
jgi:ribonucleoside-diphosphate reductase beta chain